MSKREIGCCGAYCATCREYKNGICRCCKIGYDSGERDIKRAKCAMKVCSIRKNGYDGTCADCADYDSCTIIQAFFDKNGHKYVCYKKALDYIRENGYEAFLKIADKWKGPYGKYE